MWKSDHDNLGGWVIAASSSSMRNEKMMKDMKEMLSEKFKMKDLGELKHFLGINFTQSDGCLNMSKEAYVHRNRKHMFIGYWRGLT